MEEAVERVGIVAGAVQEAGAAAVEVEGAASPQVSPPDRVGLLFLLLQPVHLLRPLVHGHELLRPLPHVHLLRTQGAQVCTLSLCKAASYEILAGETTSCKFINLTCIVTIKPAAPTQKLIMYDEL